MDLGIKDLWREYSYFQKEMQDSLRRRVEMVAAEYRPALEAAVSKIAEALDVYTHSITTGSEPRADLVESLLLQLQTLDADLERRIYALKSSPTDNGVEYLEKVAQINIDPLLEILQRIEVFGFDSSTPAGAEKLIALLAQHNTALVSVLKRKL